MGHLTSDELVDLAEDARAESSAPHLQTCAACRLALSDLREMMSVAGGLDVPEPSPLFWDHLSARVREAIAADGGPRGAWWRPSTWPRLAIPTITGAGAAVLIAVMLRSTVMAPDPAPAGLAATPPPPPSAPIAMSAAVEWTDDPSLNLVADLAAQMDWDAVSQVSLAMHEGAADEAIGQLSAAERREMRQLLHEELAGPGI